MLDLPFLAVAYPKIDPVLLQIGPFALRWYALAYIAGLVLGWLYVRNIAAAQPADKSIMSKKDADDILLWATLGVVLGGRLGYVIFYKPGYFLANPLEILQLWQGGMAFHGGLLGVVVAVALFSRARKLRFLSIGDVCCCVAPLGLFFGRIANFINGELWGRASDVSWAMVFPGDPLKLPRHPSQLYEALLEGLVLFALLWIVRRRTDALDRPGTLSGLFFAGYGIARFIVEFFRQPDAHLGFLFAGVTMGQLLSIPLVLFGAWMIWRGRNRPKLGAPAAS